MTYTNIGGSLNTPNIRIRFEDTGCYDITLKAGYGGNYDSITKKCYIHAIDYCIPQVLNLNQDVGIGFVQIRTINNSTPVGVSAYTDYTSTQSAILDKMATYQLKVGRTTVFNTMNRKVWFDYVVICAPPAKCCEESIYYNF